MYLILGLYLVLPILRIYANAAPFDNKLYFIILWFILTGMQKFLEDFSKIKMGISVVIINNEYIGFFITRDLFNRYQIEKIKNINLICIIFFIITFLICLFGTYYFSSKNKLEPFFLIHLP